MPKKGRALECLNLKIHPCAARALAWWLSVETIEQHPREWNIAAQYQNIGKTDQSLGQWHFEEERLENTIQPMLCRMSIPSSDIV